MEDIYNFKHGPLENVLKVKLINELIQIERPTHWTNDKIKNLLLEIKKIEKFLVKKNNKGIEAFNKKWSGNSI
jgi:hypothetical protein